MSETLRFDLLANDRMSSVFNNAGDSVDRTSDKLKKFAVVGAAAVAAGAVVATRALIGMAQGAAEDEAAQVKLARAMQNSAGASDKQVAGVEHWISSLGKARGVADDELRPAMGRLVQVTGNVMKAQELTNLAMDVSAGTGRSLKSVTDALAKAQTGSTAGLSKMGVETKGAEGKQRSLFAITHDLAELHGGQAAAAADTNAGKMQRLQVMYDEIKETIGAKLIPVMGNAADKTMAFITEFEKGEGVGGRVRDVLTGVGDALRTVKDNFGTIAPLLATVTGGMVAYSAATKIASVITAIQTAGTVGATGATWSLNAALRANPIGLVVTALTLLVGGLVVAYQKSETFRNIVDGAFSGVKRAGEVMWSGLKSAFSAIKDGFDALGDAGIWLWNNALQPAFHFIVGGVASILDMWSSMLSGLSKVPGFGWAKDAADAMANAAEKARGLADGIQKIPTSKSVAVTVHFKYEGLRNGSGPTRSNLADSILPRGRVEEKSFELGSLFGQGFKGGLKSKIKVALSAVNELVTRSSDRLQTLKDKAADIAGGVADAMRGALDVGSLGGGAAASASELARAQITVTRAQDRVNNPGDASDLDNQEAGLALQDAQANLAALQAQGQSDAATQLADFATQSGQFASALASAAANGLNSGLISRIAQLGPTQGLTAAQALAAMDQAQVASANASMAAVDAYANQLGQTVLTTTSLPEDIARAQGTLDALVQIRDDLKNNPRNINFTINDATDPDAVVAAIRRYVRRNGKLRDVAEKD